MRAQYALCLSVRRSAALVQLYSICSRRFSQLVVRVLPWISADVMIS